MKMRVLTTNHGKHSDTKLGFAMAADLVENASNLSGQDALDMRKLENQIGDMLSDHFKKIADRENAAFAAKGHDHLATSLDAHPEHLAEIEKAVLAAYDASPFGAGMDKAIAAANVHDVVGRWINVAQHMHRDWFAGSGKVGNHTELTDHPGWDKTNEHVVRWFDLHAPKTPEHYRRALHEHVTGEKLPPLDPVA
jgi:hypothetical protein